MNKNIMRINEIEDELTKQVKYPCRFYFSYSKQKSTQGCKLPSENKIKNENEICSVCGHTRISHCGCGRICMYHMKPIRCTKEEGEIFKKVGMKFKENDIIGYQTCMCDGFRGKQ